jgi:hypothetical protein
MLYKPSPRFIPWCLHLGSVLIAGLAEVATIMLVRLYPELLWDILSWLDAEDLVRLRMVRPWFQTKLSVPFYKLRRT